jgi:U4/U6.U5 tri-snRNP-associated protein 2
MLILEKNALKRKLDIKDEDDDEEPVIPKEKMIVKQCPYLDTINRHVLDFDFEKLCSVSLTRINGKLMLHLNL